MPARKGGSYLAKGNRVVPFDPETMGAAAAQPVPQVEPVEAPVEAEATAAAEAPEEPAPEQTAKPAPRAKRTS